MWHGTCDALHKFLCEQRRPKTTSSFVQAHQGLHYQLTISADTLNTLLNGERPGPKVIKLFSCSTQLSMKFSLLINLKLLTIANSFLLNIAEHENFSANKYENANYSWHFHIH